MSERIRTVVLMGGPDAERAVSLMSGEQVAAALAEDAGLEVIPLIVDTPTANELLAQRPDVVFPVLHGPFGEGGPMQEILEAAGVAYVGSRPKAAALAMDKVATKALVSGEGVPTPRSRELRRGDAIDLDPPLVIKPANEGSSIGLTICQTIAEAERSAQALFAMGKRVLAESFIKGREITVGIVDGDVLPIIEIIPAVEYYDYQAKYDRDDTQYILDPVLPAGVTEAVRRFTRTAWDRIGCRDLARADFLVDERGPWFLEINTMPGMTSHSLLPKAARHRGISMTQLCAGLVRRAFARQRPVAAGR